MRPVDTDRYGRTIAVVILLSGRSPNRELVGLRMQGVLSSQLIGLSRTLDEARS
jgi:hypothetical protein